jgi:NAD(P)H-dependent FMN reductase
MSTVKLLALAASFRPESLNKKLLSIAVHQARIAGADITELDYAALDTPTYKDNGDAIPAGAHAFAQALNSHQGVLLSVPEYNWSMPGGLKNLIDWVSVIKPNPFAGKTVLLMCASPSSRGGITGLQHLRTPLEVLGCWIYPQVIGVGNAGAQMKDGALIKPKDQEHLVSCVTDYVITTNSIAHARA